MREAVEIVDVGLRDGLQGIGPIVPTEWKLRCLDGLVAAGLRRIELGSFVSPAAVPQMADTGALVAASLRHAGVTAQVLVANERRGREAVAAGARAIVFVLSASEAHNRSNVGRPPRASVEEYARLLRAIPAGVPVRVDLGTAFDCPFTGRVPADDVVALLRELTAPRADVEVALCDTTGAADPAAVAALFARVAEELPGVRAWAFHGHDTYGLGMANLFSAFAAGVRVFDASFAGLGGCLFAPGATGNVATEDVARMFARMGVATGLALEPLLALADQGAALPGAQSGGVLHRLPAAARQRALQQVAPPLHPIPADPVA